MKRQITCYFSDHADLRQLEPLEAEARKRGYRVSFSDQPKSPADIGIYCSRRTTAGHNANFSMIMLHEPGQAQNAWPRFWKQEPWNSFDVGIVPGGIWESMFLENRDENEGLSPRLGVYSAGWPAADRIFDRRSDFWSEVNDIRAKLDLTHGKSILYAPSWKDGENPDDFVEYLKDIGCNILVKQATESMAYSNTGTHIEGIGAHHKGKYDCVRILDRDVSIMHALALADLLVSDASSVMIEALLFDLPSLAVDEWLIPGRQQPGFSSLPLPFVRRAPKRDIRQAAESMLRDGHHVHHEGRLISLEEYGNLWFSHKGQSSKRIMDLLEAKLEAPGWPTRTLFVQESGEWREAGRRLERFESFVKHETLSLFRYDNAPEFRYTDGDESERYLSEVMSRAQDLSESSAELRAAQIDWPSTYHLSAERGNLVRWLPLGPQHKVLEIGSGCGAISRVLGEKGVALTAVEGSGNRAMLGAQRCRDLGNVRVFNANLQDIAPEPTFDVVTLIGVLEYAGRYITDSEPWKRMLEMARAFLKPDGILIVAIENRIGLKYWAGCLEDHGAGRFASLQAYPGHDPVQTFSQAELARLLESAGLEACRFLYPWPDYKLPKVIMTEPKADRHLDNWIDPPFADHGNQKVNIFNERLAVRSVYQAGLLAEFSNSFMVLASQTPLQAHWLPEWQAKAFAVDRARQYWTETVLDMDVTKVAKMALHVPGEVPAPLSFEPRESPWQAGDSLEVALCEALMQRDASSLVRTLQRYRSFLADRFALGIHTLQGWHWLKGDAFDCLPRSVLKTANGLQAIESEWGLVTAVPEDLVVYRAVAELSRRQGEWFGQLGLAGSSTRQIIADCLRQVFPNWSEDRVAAFEAWETAFFDIMSGKATSLPFPGRDSLSLLLPLCGSLSRVEEAVLGCVEGAPEDVPCELVLVDVSASDEVRVWASALQGDITVVRVSDPDRIWWAGASVAKGEFILGTPATEVPALPDIGALWRQRGEGGITRSPDGTAFISRRDPRLLLPADRP